MYSLNVPVPGSVGRIASELHPSLARFDRVRERHSLVAKRLGEAESVDRLRERCRQALVGRPTFEARVDGIDVFESPVSGPGPVVYLRVESPGLRLVHETLTAEFDPVEGIEGDDYVPHVTLARGGDPDAVDRLLQREIDPVTWRVTELELWDATYEVSPGTLSLPG